MSSKPFLLGVCGGSGSGKTTLARIIMHLLSPAPVVILSEDDFNFDHGGNPDFDADKHNFDDPRCKDYRLLCKVLSALASGTVTKSPRYCFSTHRRLGYVSVSSADFIIVEGIHLFRNRAVREIFDLRVFINVPDDIRLARRLIRDVKERGRTQESIIQQYLETVRPMHLRYTRSLRRHAHLVLEDDGTVLPLVLFPSKDHLEVLASIVVSEINRLRHL